MPTSPDLPSLMSGVVLTAHGGPETLQWRDDLLMPIDRKDVENKS